MERDIVMSLDFSAPSKVATIAFTEPAEDLARSIFK